jgi:hypothetical protein
MANNDDFVDRRNEVLTILKGQLDNLFAHGYELALVGFEINAEHKDKGDFNIELAVNWNERRTDQEAPPSTVATANQQVFNPPFILLRGLTTSDAMPEETKFFGQLVASEGMTLEVHGTYQDVI